MIENLPVRFLRPELLLLLALLPLFWHMARRSLAGLPPARRYLALLLRLLIVALMVLALAGIQWRKLADRVAVYFVVDWSDSIPTAPNNFRSELLDYIAAASRRKEKNDLVGLIYFGADATCETPPRPLPPSTERQAVVETNGTDIAAALRLALSTFPPGSRKRVALMTDGNQNRGNALTEIEAARAQGVAVDVYPITYVHEREMLVEKVILPQSVQEGVPFLVKAIINSTAASRARVILRQGEQEVLSREIDLEARRNVVPIEVRAESDEEHILSGVIDYEVSIEPIRTGDDRIRENNRATGFSRVKGPPKVLYVDGNLGMSGYQPQLYHRLVRRLRLIHKGEEQEVMLVLVPRDRIPRQERLSGFDCIILDNVPAEAVGVARQEHIRALVNDQGVGLIMIGGKNSFGAGNYLRQPLEEALPVDMDLKHKKIMPNGALAIILHTCEFANGNFWGKQITKKAIDTLGPHDYVGVLYWGWGANNGNQWLFAPKYGQGMVPAADRSSLKKLVDKCEPGDMPGFEGTMSMGVQGLKATKAAVKHMIIISDGDPSPPSPQVTNAIRNDPELTVSTVAIGAHSTPVLLKRIAAIGNGRFYPVKNPRQLPQIFVKESMVIKRRLYMENPEGWQVRLVGDFGDEFVKDVLPANFPRLYGYVGTTLKQKAEAPLLAVNDNEDPILAHWQYGLGKAVAFTGDAKNRWGRDWLQWGRFDDFWSGIVWRVLRDQPSNLRLDTDIEAGRGRVVVQAVDDEGQPLSFLDLEARVTSPEGQSLKPLRLRQTGVGTYEGDFPADAVGKYQISVTKREGTPGPEAAAYGGASVPVSTEMENLTANETLLSRLAEKGKGRRLAGDVETDDLFNRDLPAARDFEDVWWWCLALAALLFPFDVFTRRVMIDWAALQRKLAARYAAWRGTEPPREESMDRLMDAKQEARQRGTPTFVDKAAGPADFDFQAPDASAKPKPAQPKPAETKPEAAEPTYTNRLLKAKKRARDERKRNP